MRWRGAIIRALISPTLATTELRWEIDCA